MKPIIVKAITCKKCRHTWVPRKKKPKQCVCCKQYNPDKPSSRQSKRKQKR